MRETETHLRFGSNDSFKPVAIGIIIAGTLVMTACADRIHFEPAKRVFSELWHKWQGSSGCSGCATVGRTF
jgi:hypothetical protein